MTKKTLIKASISVPLAEQDDFKENKVRLLNALANIGKKMSFSNAVRLVVNQGVLEERDGENYLVVKL